MYICNCLLHPTYYVRCSSTSLITLNTRSNDRILQLRDILLIMYVNNNMQSNIIRRMKDFLRHLVINLVLLLGVDLA